jgi:hypothetical protein
VSIAAYSHGGASLVASMGLIATSGHKVADKVARSRLSLCLLAFSSVSP